MNKFIWTQFKSVKIKNMYSLSLNTLCSPDKTCRKCFHKQFIVLSFCLCLYVIFLLKEKSNGF